MTNRGDRHVSPSFSLLYGKSSRYFWIFSGVDSLRSNRSSSLFRSCIFDYLSDSGGDRCRLEAHIDTHTSDIPRSEFLSLDIIDDFEIVPNDLLSLDTGIQPHANCSTKPDRLREFRESFNPRHPCLQLLHERLTWISCSAKHFLFRLFHKTK